MKNFNSNLEKLDALIIHRARAWALPFSRFALFVVYFWFGALKVFADSPANPLVNALLDKTMPGVAFAPFIVVFGVFEMIIGILFIIPHLERLGIFLLTIHFIAIFMPLFILPQITWQSFMTPTLEGQYIIKNILLIALALVVLGHMHILKHEKSN